MAQELCILGVRLVAIHFLAKRKNKSNMAAGFDGDFKIVHFDAGRVVLTTYNYENEEHTMDAQLSIYNNQVHFHSPISGGSGWHGSVREHGNNTISLRFDCKGRHNKLKGLTLFKVCDGQYEGYGYRCRFIRMTMKAQWYLGGDGDWHLMHRK